MRSPLPRQVAALMGAATLSIRRLRGLPIPSHPRPSHSRFLPSPSSPSPSLLLPPHPSLSFSRFLPPHPSLRFALTIVGGCLLVGMVGCGSQDVAEDATVSVYVSDPLCVGAKRELARSGSRAGGLDLRTVCLDDRAAEGTRLAAIGAAARRATEDSSSIAYVGTADPVAVRFSEPILEEADIPRVSAVSGSAGMATLIHALRRADDSGSLRESLSEELR